MVEEATKNLARQMRRKKMDKLQVDRRDSPLFGILSAVKSDDILFPPPGKTPKEDTAAVMKFYKLPKAFPPAVLAEARRISARPISDAEIKRSGRLDLRRNPSRFAPAAIHASARSATR